MSNLRICQGGKLKKFDDSGEEEPIEFSWAELRDSCEIEEGATIGDIFDLVESDSLLASFVSENYPLYNAFLTGSDSENYIIRITGSVQNDLLEFTSDKSTMDRTMPVLLDENVRIENIPSLAPLSGHHWFSLLEILDALFQYPDDRVYTLKDVLTIEGEFETVVDNPFSCLMRKCVLEKGTTLQDIFKFVEANEDILFFIQLYSWCSSIDEYHEEAKQINKKTGPGEPTYLELYKICKCTYYKKWYLDFYPEFHGKDDEGENYSVSHCHVGEISYMPVVLNDRVTIRQDHRKPNRLLKNHECRCEWTLLEILDAIYDDISFDGSPADRDAFMDMLRGRLDDLDSRYGGETE